MRLQCALFLSLAFPQQAIRKPHINQNLNKRSECKRHYDAIAILRVALQYKTDSFILINGTSKHDTTTPAQRAIRCSWQKT